MKYRFLFPKFITTQQGTDKVNLDSLSVNGNLVPQVNTSVKCSQPQSNSLRRIYFNFCISSSRKKKS